MLGLSISRLKPWRFLLALLVLPCLIGAESARHHRTLTVFDGSQLNGSHSSALSSANIQYRLLRYADIQGHSPHTEQALFYTELFTHLSLVSVVVAARQPQACILTSAHPLPIIRAPPALA